MKSKAKEIETYLRWAISSGEYTQMHKLPSENRLAIKFSCSRLTARKSLQTLKNDGLIISRKGKGYFVSIGAEKIEHQPLLKNKGVNVKFHIVKEFPLNKNEMDVFKELGMKISDLNNLNHIFFKTSHDNKNIPYTLLFSRLNSKLIENFNPNIIKHSVTNFLIKQKIIIARREEKILIINPPQIVKLKMHLKSHEHIVAAYSIMFDNKDNIVEIAIRYTLLSQYSERFTKKY